MVRLLFMMAWWLSPVDDANACVAYWQRELGLDHWIVIAKVVRDGELGGSRLGEIEIYEPAKTAIIHVMRVEDSDLSRRLARAEQRFTIAHELMHLRLYADNDPNWRDEKAVDTAVISLMRRRGRWNELLAVEHE
jgi:hypothetical protein